LPTNVTTSSAKSERVGFACALGAYLAWGFMPGYFKLLTHVPPLVVLSHRIVWSVAFLAVLLTATRRWSEVFSAIRRPATLIALVSSTTSIAINWFVFIWAVSNRQVMQASLGYFINPLVNVLLGVVILRERLRPGQLVSLILATAGVAVMTFSAGGVPWVAVGLAFSFSFYGLLRKITPVGPIPGLSVETAILFPVALIIATGFAPRAMVGSTNSYAGATATLLTASGVITAVPLMLFAAGARRLRLGTLGFLQYVSPTCQFLLAVFAYHEPFTTHALISFTLIWTAVAAYTFESVMNLRAAKTSEASVAELTPVVSVCPE
jgi:chloramphenicol-sensitive protein RarD